MKELNLKGPCPKCGHKKVRTHYCSYSRGYLSVCDGIEKEHIHRTCQLCGYEWLEKCEGVKP